MGRRAKPSKGKAEAKRSLSVKSPKNEGARVRDLENRLAESLEREKATGRARNGRPTRPIPPAALGLSLLLTMTGCVASKPVPPPAPILKARVEVSAQAEIPAHPVRDDEATR
jgi:hypothetical protein